MANRRMFSLSIVDTDRFLEMPSSTQALYFHLGMRADDDGFVAAPKSIAAICGCSVDDIRLLAMKGFVQAFETGVLVITDWKENNKIRKDRYTPTKFIHEKMLLGDNQNDNQSDTQTATKWLPQDRLGKDMRKLRRNPALCRFHDEIIQHHAYRGTGFAAWQHGSSVEEHIIEYLESKSAYLYAVR